MIYSNYRTDVLLAWRFDMRVEKHELHTMDERELRRYKRILKLRRQRRKKMYTAIVTLLLTFALVFSFAVSQGAIKSNANSGFKYFTQYYVEPGDTLWDIAEEFIDYEYYKTTKLYLEEVCAMNHIDMDQAIYSGQMLFLPYYDEEYIY